MRSLIAGSICSACDVVIYRRGENSCELGRANYLPNPFLSILALSELLEICYFE